MKTFQLSKRKSLYTAFQVLLLTFTLNSCDRDKDMSTLNNAARARQPVPNVTQCPTGYHYDFDVHQCVVDDPEPNPCITSSDVNARERNRAIESFGSNAGDTYDRVAASTSDPYSVIAYNYRVQDYTLQIRTAVLNASNAYANSVSSNTAYDPSTYLSYINNYLNPLQNTISNDANLNAAQRGVLLQVFTSINDNFSEISYLVTSNIDCFPNPSGLGSNSIQNRTKIGGPITNSWFGNVLKKIVNVIATVVVDVVVNTVKFGVIAAGEVIDTIFLIPVAFTIGAAYGAIYGVTKGIKDSINGDYVCIFSGVGNCP